MGKEAEIITKGEQGVLMNLQFTLVIKVGQDPSVFSE
jgi:hypothetical protein